MGLCVQKHCDLGESYVYKEKITWRKMWRVISTPSNLCCIGQGLPGSLPWGVILTFFNVKFPHNPCFKYCCWCRCCFHRCVPCQLLTPLLIVQDYLVQEQHRDIGIAASVSRLLIFLIC